jgi:hypothetical protein
MPLPKKRFAWRQANEALIFRARPQQSVGRAPLRPTRAAEIVDVPLLPSALLT